MSRILVYIMFALLVASIGFSICIPPELQPRVRDARRLEILLSALQSNPKRITSVRLINGRSNVAFKLGENEQRELTTVIPIEWKGQFIQQLVDKHVPFTVEDADYTLALLAGLAAIGVGYFRFIMLPQWSHRTCPHCAERVNGAARICRYCGVELSPLILELGSSADAEEDEDEDEEAEAEEGIESAQSEQENAVLVPHVTPGKKPDEHMEAAVPARQRAREEKLLLGEMQKAAGSPGSASDELRL